MKYLLSNISSMFVFSGLVKIAAGIAVFLWPSADFDALIYFFGIPAIIQSILYINAAAYNRTMYDQWWVLLLPGIVYMATGVITLGYPDITPEFLMIMIAATWSLAGLIMIMLYIQLVHESKNEFKLLLSGVLSIMAGIYLVTHLSQSVYSILWVIVAYCFLIGLLTFFFGLKAKGWQPVYFDDIME